MFVEAGFQIEFEERHIKKDYPRKIRNMLRIYMDLFKLHEWAENEKETEDETIGYSDDEMEALDEKPEEDYGIEWIESVNFYVLRKVS